MPILYQNDKMKKVLFLQKNRCGGCHFCVEVCPKKILKPSNELNMKLQYPPHLKKSIECTFCQSCELVCPDFAIYVLQDESYQELIQKK
ncbi:MAG: ferredoxin family protein [Promethearchaeota archaeon]